MSKLNNNGIPPAELVSPTRNSYFYGKLLDSRHFETEQDYFSYKRWLLNRLGLGTGVLRGLQVEPTDDGEELRLTAGVAIDALGREIIVPKPHDFDPREITGPCGDPRERIEEEGKEVTVCLVFHECGVELVPVLQGECEENQTCAPSTIRERFKVLVLEGKPDAVIPDCFQVDLFDAPQPTTKTPKIFLTDEALRTAGHGDAGSTASATAHADMTIGPAITAPEKKIPVLPEKQPVMETSASRVHKAVAQEISQASPTAGTASCVVLAHVRLPAAGDPITPTMIDTNVRPVVYNNPLLFQLLLCLGKRVEQRFEVLRQVSGDAQTGATGAVLDQAVVVKITDSGGKKLKDVPVTLRILGGNGHLLANDGRQKSLVAQSNAHGMASAKWQLGPDPGLNTLEATIPSGARVCFHALAVEVEQLLLYISGDAQTGATGTVLDQAVVVKVVERDDAGVETPIAGETVTFRVMGEDGRVRSGAQPFDTSCEVSSAAGDGMAAASWQLGLGGLNTLEATIPSGSRVTFHALAETLKPPVVEAIVPANASNLKVEEIEPRLEITFDREMKEEQLRVAGQLEPDIEWLRVWQILQNGPNEIIIQPARLNLSEVVEGTAIYDIEDLEPSRYLIQIWARNDNIVDAGKSPRMLDAEFSGTDLTKSALYQIWQITGQTTFDAWEYLVDTGELLPSGDGNEGGRFHSWFEVS